MSVLLGSDWGEVLKKRSGGWSRGGRELRCCVTGEWTTVPKVVPSYLPVRGRQPDSTPLDNTPDSAFQKVPALGPASCSRPLPGQGPLQAGSEECSRLADSPSQANPYLDVAPESVEVKEAADVAAVGVTAVLHLPHHHDVPGQESDLSSHVHTVDLLPDVQVQWFP